MHINDARLIATVVRSTTGIIAVANREQKLSDTVSHRLVNVAACSGSTSPD